MDPLAERRCVKVLEAVIGVLLLLVLPGNAHGQSYVGKGYAVLDGDTIRLLRETGQIVQVEFYGIDAPELGQPSGLAARQSVRRAIYRARVRAVAEDHNEDGRPLFMIYVGDTVLNEQLVRNGRAWWDRRQAPHADRLRRLEQHARTHDRGLWTAPSPTPPWEWRAKKKGS